MTMEQLIQLYAPVAGLLGVVFALGMLWARVIRAEKDIAELSALKQKVAGIEAIVGTLTAGGAATVDLKVEVAKLAQAMTDMTHRMTEMKDDTHNALEGMRAENTRILGEINHIVRGRLATLEAAEHLSARGRGAKAG